MAGIERSRKLNKIFRILNHSIFICGILGFLLVVTLVETPFEKKLDLQLPRISLDELYQQAKSVALELQFQLVKDDLDDKSAEFVKKESGATSRLKIKAEKVEDYKTGIDHHWIRIRVQNEGFSSKFTLPAPKDISKEFLELLDKKLIEMI